MHIKSRSIVLVVVTAMVATKNQPLERWQFFQFPLLLKHEGEVEPSLQLDAWTRQSGLEAAIIAWSCTCCSTRTSRWAKWWLTSTQRMSTARNLWPYRGEQNWNALRTKRQKSLLPPIRWIGWQWWQTRQTCNIKYSWHQRPRKGFPSYVSR